MAGEEKRLEELENETNGNTIDQEGEEHRALIEGGELGAEAEDGGKIQRQRNLHKGTYHVVETDAEGGEQFILGKDADVVLQADKAAVLGVAHIEKAELHHLGKGIVGKHDQQKNRNHGKGEDHQPLLILGQGKPFFEGFPSARTGCGSIDHGHGTGSFLWKKGRPETDSSLP